MAEKFYHFPVQNFNAHLFRLAKLEHGPMAGAFLGAELVIMGGVRKIEKISETKVLGFNFYIMQNDHTALNRILNTFPDNSKKIRIS